MPRISAFAVPGHPAHVMYPTEAAELLGGELSITSPKLSDFGSSEARSSGEVMEGNTVLTIQLARYHIYVSE
jgi:hypothetical protein